MNPSEFPADFPFVVPLEGGSNFRDLGGHKASDGRLVRRGHVFRSAHLGALTDAGRQRLQHRRRWIVADFAGVR